MSRRRPKIEIHVEELALFGFGERESAAIVASLGRALERYFAESMGAVPERGLSHAYLDGGAVERSGKSADALGAELGDRVGRTIAP